MKEKKSPLAGHPLEAFTRMMFTGIICGLSRGLRDDELSIAQVAALHLIAQRGSLRISDLSEPLGLSASALSRLIDDLVKRGLLLRKEDKEDRRAKVLTLAAKGTAFIERVGEARVKAIVEMTSTLPPEAVKALLEGIKTWQAETPEVKQE